MEKELEIAILFDAYYIESVNLQYFSPTRILIGRSDEEKLKFYDNLSQKVYYNIDYALANHIQQSFNLCTNLNEMRQKYKNDDIAKLSELYLEETRKYVYYVNQSKPQVVLREDINKFCENTGINITYGFVKDDEHKFDDKKINVKEAADKETGLPNILEAYKDITKHVLCQNDAVKKLLTAVYKNICLEDETMKSNILMYGSTGVGKTAMLKRLAKLLDLPMVIEDSTKFTMSAYKGRDANEALRDLYLAADEDLEYAERGILVFDEIDKLANKEDVTVAATEGTINGFLKIVEGSVFNVEIDSHETIQFDTSKLTVIFAGAFSQMDTIINGKKNTIGFANTTNNTNTKKIYNSKDFIKYGFSPEFIGRINCFIPLNSLKLEDIKNILLNSNSSSLKAYREVLKKIKVNLDIPDELIELIAEKAYKMNSGARSLNVIVNEIFENIMFELFAHDLDINEIVLSPEILEDNANGFKFVKKEQKVRKKVLKYDQI